MTFQQFYGWIERLRKESSGEPVWIAAKEVYEYQDRSPKVVAVLKLVRAAHGISALNLLCRGGLLIDFGVIMRCVDDCVAEIYFLLENYPQGSTAVDRFVDAFFETTIDGFLGDITPTASRKIRAAMVRALKGRHDDAMQKITERIHKTFSGYVHANYSHTMEVYNGRTASFNLAGVPSVTQREERMLLVNEAVKSVLNAAAFTAYVLGKSDLLHEIVQNLQ